MEPARSLRGLERESDQVFLGDLGQHAAVATPLVLVLGRIRTTARMPRYTLYWFYPLHLLALAGPKIT